MVYPELVKVCEMVFPDPGENPVTVGELPETVQEKVAPVTSEFRLMLVCWDEQTDCDEGTIRTSGTGYTDTVKSVASPLHPLL